MLSFILGIIFFTPFIACQSSSPINQTRGGPNAPALPVYKVNLDAPPATRWTQIATDYNASIWRTVNTIESWVPALLRGPLFSMLAEIGADLESHFPEEFAQEMLGISEVTGVPPGLVVLCNLVYELVSACTSVVAQAPNGTVFHARNLDFGDGGAFTSDLTVDALNVYFLQSGGVRYVATTYAGYIGVLTGERAGAFSVSIDQHLGPSWEVLFNVVEGIYLRKASVIGLLIRQVLDSNASYPEALRVFSDHALLAEVYIILAGVSSGQGAVITRMRNFPQNVWPLDAAAGRWYVLETNYPHWKPDNPTDDRATVAEAQMQAMGQQNLSYDGLWGVLSTVPVLNALTTYTALMYPAQGGPEHYLAYQRYCGEGCPTY